MYMKFIYSLSLIFLLIQCSVPDTDNYDILHYNESDGISTLDPAFAKDKSTIWATSQIFSSLVRIDDSLKISPLIASNWLISPDGKEYTFNIRTDVHFHNHPIFIEDQGRRVVASDFVYSFNRLLDPQLASPGSWVLDNVDTFYAENDSVFKIILHKPFSPFLSILGMQYCSVVPKELADLSSFGESPIGTGPFMYQYWKYGSKLVLRKNPNYFEFDNDNRLPYLDAIAITFIKDKQSEFLSFLQGDLDFISGLDASYKDELLDLDGKLKFKYRDQINFESINFLNTEYFGFLMDSVSPFKKNIYLRKAINYAINREQMIKYLRNNIGTPANNGIVPVSMYSNTSNLNGYKYDIEKAKYYLYKSDSMGYEIPPITINTTDNYLDLCEYIQNQLNSIGLNVSIEVNPSSIHRDMVAKSKIDFFRASWIADYPDPENYLSLFYSRNNWNNGLNKTHFRNYEFDDLYETSIIEKDPEKRELLYLKMERIIIDESIVVPLYYDQIVRFYNHKLIGISTNSQNHLNLLRVKKIQ